MQAAVRKNTITLTAASKRWSRIVFIVLSHLSVTRTFGASALGTSEELGPHEGSKTHATHPSPPTTETSSLKL